MFSKLTLFFMLALVVLDCSAMLNRVDIEKIGRSTDVGFMRDSVGDVDDYIISHPNDILGYITKAVVLIKIKADHLLIDKAISDVIKVVNPKDADDYRFAYGNALFQGGYCDSGLAWVSAGGFNIHDESSAEYTISSINYLECMRLGRAKNLDSTYNEVLSKTNFDIEATLSYLEYLLDGKRNNIIFNVVAEYEKRKPRSKRIMDFLCDNDIACNPKYPIE